MKKLLILIIILVGAWKAQAQPVSFSVQGDGDDWQLYMSGKLMADLNSGGKVVFITLTAGDEGHGNTSFNGSLMPYYVAREKGALYSAKFANDIVEGSGNPAAMPVLQTVTINGHSLVKYVYKSTVSYFLRLPDGNTNGSGFSATGNASLKKLKDGTINSLISVDGNNTYTGWSNLTSTIEAIINAEKGSNTEVWLNTGSLDAVANPNDHSDHVYSSTAAEDAVNALSWVGINEFINDHSSNLSPNLATGVFQTASAIFSLSGLALIENNYPTKFTVANKAWLPMDYYTVKRSPSACAIPGGLTTSSINNTGATVGWTGIGGILSYDVDYKLSTASTWINAATATTATSVALSGLTQGTLYDWRVRSNCSSGSGIYATSQFTTTAPPSCNAPTGLSTTNITATSATANWSAVSGAASYDVDYKLSTSSTWISAAAATVATSINISGLTAASVYDWRVRANCTAVGLTSLYTQEQFSTPAPGSCNAPTGLASLGITINAATVSWLAVSGAADYNVEYKQASSATWITAAATTALSFNLSGLTAGSVYDWRVKANCTAVGLSSIYTQVQFTTQTLAQQPVSFSVQGDGDDWQLYMSGKLMADLNSGGKVVFITLTAGDEGHGNTSFNGSLMPYYVAREKGALYSAKFANDIVEGSGNPAAMPVLQTVTINGHSLVKYVYKSTVSYFLRLPDGNTNGSGFSATGNASLKKLKDGTINSLISVDGNNTYTGWSNLTSTIEAIINAEKGSNTEVWLNTGSLDAVANPGDHADHIYSSTAAQDAVNGLSWVGINEFINDHSSNLSPNLGTYVFQTASAIFGLSALALIENNYPTKFTAANKAWLPMDYYTVKRSPSACAVPGGLTTSSITNTGATVSWTATAGALSYDVDYKLSTVSTWTNAATATTGTSVVIGSLSQGTVYDWRVRSNCSSGSGIYATSQFTTTASCNAPSGLVSSAITLNSATISWTAVNGAVNYTVEYKLASASTWITSATATTAVSVNLAGLAHTSLYDWRVRANCTAFGLTSIYAQAQFTTLTATCIAPTGLVPSAITLNSATISWTAASGAASYSVDYRLSTSSTWINLGTAINAVSVNLSGLAQSSLYDWRVRANCTAVGLTSIYALAQFGTLTPPSCNAPTGLASSAIALNSATISWTAVSGAASYDVDYKLSTSSTWINSATATTAVSVNLTGLAHTSLYDWRLRANCTAVGLTSVYAQAQFSTLTATCNTPAGLVSSAITLNSATISWAPVSGAANYTVEYKLATSSTWTTSATATTAVAINLTGLLHSLLYDWRVRANCTSVGLTSAYAQAQFSTLIATCNAPTGLTSSAITLNSATISWTAVSGALNYTVEYKLASASTYATVASATTALTMNLTGLTSGSAYDWRVRANCTSVGLTSAYAQAQFSTLIATCNAPTGLTSSAITLNSAIISWTAVSGAANYTVEYKLGSASTWITAASTTTAVSVNLAGLAHTSLYNWRVRANCTAVGLTSAYAQSQFTTVTATCNTPTGLTASNITTTSVTVSWTPVSGAASYRIEGKLASDATWITLETEMTAATATATGLDPSTTYDWRVRANCTAVGLTSAYAQSQVTTLTPTCNAPTGLTSSAITFNSAIISWTAVTGAANYTVEYKLTSASTYTTAAAATTALTINLTGLAHTSLYVWRVRANCTAVGLTSIYAQAQFGTLTPLSCNAPTGLASSAIALNSAIISWTAVSGAANYTVEYKLGSASTWITAASTTTAVSVNLAGLAHSSLYNWRVRANCTAVGLTSAYAQSQFTTVTATCNAPTGLTSSAITLNSATISWTAVSGAANYTVEYKLASASTYTTVASATTALTMNLTGLTSGSAYDWRVRANCTAVGLTSAYAQSQFTTVTATCNAPTGLTSSAITLNSAIISWTAVSGAANYTIEYKLASASTWITAASTTTAVSVNLAGLAHSSLYNWRVRANCTAVGLTSAYAQSQFTTVTATCNAPTGLTSSAITLNSATISWTAVSGAANYTVEYKLASASTYTTVASATTALTMNLTGLTSGSAYDWRVRANCTAVGLTSAYTQALFTTVTATCNAPTGLTSSAITLNSAIISWTAVSGAANYTVEYKLGSASTWITAASTTTAVSVNLAGLAHSSLYNWRVRANCTAVGLTSAYAQSQFTTVTATCNAPTGLTSSAITLNSATISWTAVSGAANYTVEYKLGSASTWITAASTTTAVSVNLAGLAHSSLYNWRVRANCTAVGLTSAYAQSQFTTVTATCNTPTGLTASNITTTSVTVSWTPVSGAASYRIEGKLASDATWITLETEMTAATATATGLDPSTTYDWRVRANCTAVGLTSAYAQSQVTTLTPTCNAPTGLTSSAITLNSSTISWDPVSGAANYRVEYKLASASTWITITSATTTISVNLTGLSNSSLYQWRVRANCSAVGLTSAYTQSQFTTLTPTCNAPPGLASSAITTNSTTVSWAAVSGAASYAVEYKLASASSWITSTTSTTSTSRSLTGLTQSSSYQWRVRANCTAVGLTSAYTQSQFTTLGPTCNAPTGLSTTNLTSTSATLNWAAVSGAASYAVEYKLASASAWIISTTSTTSTNRSLTGLTQSTLYQWRVRANCTSIGLTSAYSQSQFTTTCADQLEPNETYSDATTIPVETDITAQISSSGDDDYYKFSNSYSQPNISVKLTNLPADYDMKLYHPFGILIETADNRGNANETIIYNPNSVFLNVGTYRVYVYGYNGASSNTQCYTIRIDLSDTDFRSSSSNFGATTPVAGKSSEAVITNNELPVEKETITVRIGEMKVYPVPASSVVNVSFDAFAKGNATIMISNQLGQEVMRKTVGVDNGINIATLNVSDLRSGIYSIRVNNGTDVQTKRLVITR